MNTTREEPMSVRRVFVFGGFQRKGEQKYLVMDIPTKTVYVGTEPEPANGLISLTEFNSAEYLSMLRGLQKGDVKDLDIMPGSLMPNSNGSMSFLAQIINFESAMPKEYTVQ